MHPKTRFIAAHFGWHANDLKRAAAMLDFFPKVVVEVGAILYDLRRVLRLLPRLSPFSKLYGMSLPDVVRKKLYYRNALRVVKGMPAAGWP